MTTRIWISFPSIRAAVIAGALLCLPACLTTFDADGVTLAGDNDGGGDPDTGVDTDDNNDGGQDTGNNGVCTAGSTCDPGLLNATGTCSQDEVCEATGCVAGTDDCNMDLTQPDSDGCEADLASPETCGDCSTACGGLNALWSCVNSTCEQDGCEAGWADDDGMANNGCEFELPNPPGVTSTEVVNNGVRINIQPSSVGVPATSYEVNYQLGDGDSVTRRFPAEVLGEAKTELTIGPLDASTLTPLSLTVSAVGVGTSGTEYTGAPSPEQMIDFLPAGWFVRSPAYPLTIDLTFPSAQFGLLTGLSHNYFLLDGGQTFLPSKPSLPEIIARVDLFTSGELAGYGIGISGVDANYQYTTNFGISWTAGTVTLTQNDSFDAALTLTGGAFMTAGELYYAPALDQTFSPATVSGLTDTVDSWQGLFVQPDSGRVFVVGNSSVNGRMTVIASGTETNLSQLTTIPGEFDEQIVMPSTTKGFLVGDDGIVVTNNAWTDYQIPTLNDPDCTTCSPNIIRLATRADGMVGVAVAGSRSWVTNDGGATWSYFDLPGDDETWAGVALIPGSGAFVLTSVDGSIASLSVASILANNPSLDPLVMRDTGLLSDGFVSVTQANNLESIWALAGDGRIFGGSSVPETLTEVSTTGPTPATPQEIVSNDAGDKIFSIGSEGAYYSADGIAWQLLRSDDDWDLRDLAIPDAGNGWAVGFTRASDAALILRINTDLAVPSAQNYDPNFLNPAGLSGVTAVAASVSNDGNYAAIATDEPAVYYLRDDAWTRFPVPTTPNSVAVHQGADADNIVWICSNGGALSRIAAAGGVRTVLLPLPAYSSLSRHSLIGCQVPADDDHIFVNSDGGWTWVSTDGGANWTPDLAHLVNGGFFDVNFVDTVVARDNLQGLAVGLGGQVLWTANGGMPNPPVPDAAPGREDRY